VLISILELLLQFAAASLCLATIAFAAQAMAAILLRERPLPLSARRPSVAVLVPAHNEEGCIAATLFRIKQDLSPNDRLLVVADNCTDQTAQVAARAGADTVARNDPSRRGKGFALAAGLRHLAAAAPEVVIFVDADCQISRRCVELLARACAAANAPVQCLDLMLAKPGSEAPERLAEFAWRIKNEFRPSGYARLGLPCHLLGTGMAIPWSLIDLELFATGHLAEDLLFGLELAVRGHPPRFLREAKVTSYFPETQGGHAQQKQRWIYGHFGLIKSHSPRLIYQGLRRRDVGLLALAADLAVPPLGVLAIANIVLAMLFLISIAIGGAVTPLGLVAAANSLFAFSLVTSWSVCGRNLIGWEEVRRLPRHAIMVMRSVWDLARGHSMQWIRADRLDADV
jgi:cellulose synthase/poly-beta-1,6-N-acetylglucosamine synthase-like glycosyltransferase